MEDMTAVDKELHDAYIELDTASHRFNAAILARIALRTVINKENE